MKTKLISLAIATAFTGSAFATPADITVDTPDVTIVLSGASAQDPILMKYLNEDICGGNSTGMTYASAPTWSGAGAASTFYGFGTTAAVDANGVNVVGNGSSHYAVFCTATGADGIAIFGAGKKVLVTKRSAGGSFYGVGPVIDGVNPSVYDPADTNGLMVVSAASCPTAVSANRTNCTGKDLTNTVTPQAGLSDVEGPLFTKVGGIASPAAGYPAPYKTGLTLQGFGVAVSTELNDALVAFQMTGDGVNANQLGQVLPVTTCGITATAWDAATHRTTAFTGTATRSEACQPSLTRSDVANAFSPSGNIKQNWVPVVGTLGTGKVVHACRRVDTSGTEMSFRTYFLNAAANGSLAGFWTQGTAAASTTTRKWYELSGTGNMKDCLNHVANTAAGDFAIGYMSLENTPGGAGKYNYVKINGVSGNYDAYGKQKQNLIEGTYDFGYETVAYVNAAAPAVVGTFMTNFANNTASVAAGTIDPLGLAVVPKTGTTYKNSPNRVAKGSRKGNSFSPFQELPAIY